MQIVTMVYVRKEKGFFFLVDCSSLHQQITLLRVTGVSENFFKLLLVGIKK